MENESGVELLNYLAQILLLQTPSYRKREFTFKPGSIDVQTWQHPRSKLWRCIDLVIVQRRWLYLISDSNVIRSAECYSDHKLVCLTYNLALPFAKRQPRRRTTQCFAVGDLISAVGSLVDDVVVASSTQAAYSHVLQGHRAEWLIKSSIKDQ